MRKHKYDPMHLFCHPLWMFAAGVVLGVSIGIPGAILDGYFLSRTDESPVRRIRFITQVVPDTQMTVPSDIETVPAFGSSTTPISRVPNWGAMRNAAQWNRTFTQMAESDFVSVPAYDLALTEIPVRSLIGRTAEQIPILTAKLFYSTRFMGTYDLDAGEFTGVHAGIDLKLPSGTPVGAIGGGRVVAVRNDDILGTHVLIEHMHPAEGSIVSIYGHLGSTRVREGDAVSPGDIIGTVGMTGNTAAPHLHLQIDRTRDARRHVVYAPKTAPSREEAARRTINPADIIDGFRP